MTSLLVVVVDLSSWQYWGYHNDDLGEGSVSGRLQRSDMHTLLPCLRGRHHRVSGPQYHPCAAGEPVFPPAFWRGLAVPHQGQCADAERSRHADSYCVNLSKISLQAPCKANEVALILCSPVSSQCPSSSVMDSHIRKVIFEHSFAGSAEHGSCESSTWASSIICFQSG